MKKATVAVVLGLFSIALLSGCCGRRCEPRCEPKCEPKCYERVVKEYGGK